MSDDRIDPTALILGRLVAAPRSNVFRAWTEPELLARWWWPARFRTTYEVDLRPGGRWRFRTADLPDLGVLTVGGAFLEVRAPERLVYTWVWEGEGGDAGDTLVTVEFRDRGDQTEVLVRHERFADGSVRDGHAQGWADCLDRLVHATQPESDAIRWRVHLHAPPAVVHRMLSTDEGRARFWAEAAIEDNDAIVFTFPNGDVWRGDILEDIPPHRYAVRYYGGCHVTFSLSGDGADGTDLTLTDVGEPAGWRTEVIAGWVSVLLALKAAVDFGVDLRNHNPGRTWDEGFADN